MSQPLTVNIPHALGRLEARRRIDDGIGRLTGQFGANAEVQQAWAGDKLNFTVKAMGQTVTGALDVLDDKVVIAVVLPAFLSFISGKIKSRLQQEGQLMLEKKSPLP